MIIINVETVVVLHILFETVIHFFRIKKINKKNLTINFSGGVYFLYLFSGLLRGP